MDDVKQNKGGVLMAKKKPGYYWRLRRKLMKELHNGDVLVLTKYPARAQVYIIRMSFKDLPKITIN